jgi:hypothetical protein
MLAGECMWFHIRMALCLSDTQTDHEGMIGVRRTEAGNDVTSRKGKKENKKHDIEFEEWTGIS